MSCSQCDFGLCKFTSSANWTFFARCEYSWLWYSVTTMENITWTRWKLWNQFLRCRWIRNIIANVIFLNSNNIKILYFLFLKQYGGKMDREEHTMAMVTVWGGLCVKILKRTADFSSIHNAISNLSLNDGYKFLLPKETRLFFQQGLLWLRLTVAKKVVEILNNSQDTGPYSLTMEATVLGLGPNYQIRISLTNVSDELSDTDLYIVCRTENTNVKPRVMDAPLFWFL